jgi:hypothetical protein
MKKILFLVLLFATISITNLHAQQEDPTETSDSIVTNISREKTISEITSPYRASIGGVVYPSLAVGPSFKFFLTNHLALQTDILFRAVFTGCAVKDTFFPVLFFIFETRNNVIYQKKFKDKETYELFWFIGAGISLGCQFQGNGKFGVNTMMGLELCAKKIPLTFQFDLHPGYAMLFNLFNLDNRPIEVFGTRGIDKNPWSYFDWLIAFTLRYTLKEKESKKQ